MQLLLHWEGCRFWSSPKKSHKHFLCILPMRILIHMSESFWLAAYQCFWSERRFSFLCFGRSDWEHPTVRGEKSPSHWCFHWDLLSKCSEFPLSPNTFQKAPSQIASPTVMALLKKASSQTSASTIASKGKKIATRGTNPAGFHPQNPNTILEWVGEEHLSLATTPKGAANKHESRLIAEGQLL